MCSDLTRKTTQWQSAGAVLDSETEESNYSQKNTDYDEPFDSSPLHESDSGTDQNPDDDAGSDTHSNDNDHNPIDDAEIFSVGADYNIKSTS